MSTISDNSRTPSFETLWTQAKERFPNIEQAKIHLSKNLNKCLIDEDKVHLSRDVVLPSATYLHRLHQEGSAAAAHARSADAERNKTLLKNLFGDIGIIVRSLVQTLTEDFQQPGANELFSTQDINKSNPLSFERVYKHYDGEHGPQLNFDHLLKTEDGHNFQASIKNMFKHPQASISPDDDLDLISVSKTIEDSLGYPTCIVNGEYSIDPRIVGGIHKFKFNSNIP